MTARLDLEYDGRGFAGWARQPGRVRSVQAEVERALSVLLRRSVSVVVAGRTDAGVHALGQVCSYEGEPVEIRALNGLLPGDVSALSCAVAPEGFDARRDATSRAYCYRVCVRRARPALDAGRMLWWRGTVDFGALEACASALVGVHDFTAFTPTETEHVRFEREVLTAFWRRGAGVVVGGAEGGGVGGWGGGGDFGSVGGRGGAGSVLGRGDVLEFWIEADAFMRHMNRVLVGTMLEVAGGRRSVADFVRLLEGRPRPEAGPTAPAHGLYLLGVGYGGERVIS